MRWTTGIPSSGKLVTYHGFSGARRSGDAAHHRVLITCNEQFILPVLADTDSDIVVRQGRQNSGTSGQSHPCGRVPPPSRRSCAGATSTITKFASEGKDRVFHLIDKPLPPAFHLRDIPFCMGRIRKRCSSCGRRDRVDRKRRAGTLVPGGSHRGVKA
ncbi:MAG: hypothetical protein MZV70_30545 [Desulfobacterales bacterium]|nr:hypothetical protein [Desulfobacterales bacterium]